MTEEQKDKLKHFLDKPLMYIYELDKKQVIAFIHGFQTGDQNLGLTTLISNLLETRERIIKEARGCPQQIQIYADKKGLKWFEAMKNLTMDIIDNKA